MAHDISNGDAAALLLLAIELPGDAVQRSCYTCGVKDFFAELDELRVLYMGRNLTDEKWNSVVRDLLYRIDVLMPYYKSVATADQVAVSVAMHASLFQAMADGVFPDLREAAIDAATLEKSLAGAIGTTFSGKGSS